MPVRYADRSKLIALRNESAETLRRLLVEKHLYYGSEETGKILRLPALYKGSDKSLLNMQAKEKLYSDV